MVRVASSKRSDRVVFPWSMWAMMQKLRVFRMAMERRTILEARSGVKRRVMAGVCPTEGLQA
jgi:hypothetical protein